MSRSAFIDVFLEINTHELARESDPTRTVWDLMRTKADAQCAEVGATLRTDRAPEIIVKEAHGPLQGYVTLIASRWAVEVPERIARTL